jgi:ABC-type antimicrobial peptide transport system permease subunit
VNYVSVTGPQTRKSWPEDTHVVENIISANYFDAMGIRLLAGQGFGAGADRADTVVVNMAFARKFLQGHSPVGRTLWLGPEQQPREILGVVNDTKGRVLRDDAPPMVYQAWQRNAQENVYVRLSVRSAGFTPSSLAMAQAIEQLVPGASVEVRSLDVEVADTIATERATATLAFFFGVCGLLLAAIGLYGVLSREVHVRRPEIAVRMALGAAPQGVRRLVMFRVLAATASGLILGVGLSLGAGRLVQSLLYEVQPSDAGQLLTCIAILLLVAIAAVAAPVRRATRVDPMTVLRSE